MRKQNYGSTEIGAVNIALIKASMVLTEVISYNISTEYLQYPEMYVQNVVAKV
jgi:hypothetical protein